MRGASYNVQRIAKHADLVKYISKAELCFNIDLPNNALDPEVLTNQRTRVIEAIELSPKSDDQTSPLSTNRDERKTACVEMRT